MVQDNPANVSDAAQHGAGSFTYLDRALWKQFREADSPEAFARAWLGVQCRLIEGATGGVVVLGEGDTGPYQPIAAWPDFGAVTDVVSTAAERAMAERQGVVVGSRGDVIDDPGACIAQPVIVDEQLVGVVALTVAPARASAPDLLRQLRWGAGWIEVLLRREQARHDEALHERTETTFDVMAAVLEHERFVDACNAVVAELATRLDCDPVALGVVRSRRTRVVAISHSAEFGQRMNLVREIGEAMDEAIDQKSVIVHPHREDWEYRVTRAHVELAADEHARAVLTVPLLAHGEVCGAITLLRTAGETFDEVEIELADAVVSVIGPVLEEKRRNDRLILTKLGESLTTQARRVFGPHYFGRKLATAVALAVVSLFALVTGEYRVTSPATLEGRIQRTIVAPFDGYLASQHARAGEIVREGDVLASLDDQDLALERIRWSTRQRQSMAEYDQALAQGKRAEANIVRAQIDQAAAQVALLDEQLARTKLRAPFDGVVVSGDLSQSVGNALRRGEELFRIAPLAEHRVILEVDEGDVTDVEPGQQGTLRLASMPARPLPYTVERVTPVAEQGDGRNFFRVEARLDASDDRLRPGMEGVAKTEAGEKLVIRIWTEKLLDWLRLTSWKWLP